MKLDIQSRSLLLVGFMYIALQKAYKKIFAGAGISKELTASIWEAASKHQGPKMLKMEDVTGKKKADEGAIVRRKVVKKAVGAPSGSLAPGAGAAAVVGAAAAGGGGVSEASSASDAPEATAAATPVRQTCNR